MKKILKITSFLMLASVTLVNESNAGLSLVNNVASEGNPTTPTVGSTEKQSQVGANPTKPIVPSAPSPAPTTKPIPQVSQQKMKNAMQPSGTSSGSALQPRTSAPLAPSNQSNQKH